MCGKIAVNSERFTRSGVRSTTASNSEKLPPGSSQPIARRTAAKASVVARAKVPNVLLCNPSVQPLTLIAKVRAPKAPGRRARKAQAAERTIDWGLRVFSR